ncbi:tRNA glutamyl-Q(34) synthetase GluQRS [Aeromonas simiae]|uniref:tRNA glutamyl-Q(34) synthetase GluQRS n=1 Tax=Aeromonas simiae TaxID=218936 RepID=UPI00266D0C4B|nr:tRNA glutamyl-Q(34) synthetase GluQRS [Aeromonas simiae]MDO2949731.1 tRNA glutamyl-Q(34) synthetase GluQRS [Aeromonas simiae]MDO2953404.1 tRNA glutamyl-Q(34) synthetase GluQRS [Aeromonas simiae]MDO2957062.1 tRNA glutamyl-Q(34) synthetase GluQRS [Aeromonas simiae]
MQTPYVGRFAPSPSGPLHFGSLIAALGSYLQARAHSGRWLVRIEDIDPPREMAGASDLILRTLEHYGLEWDGEVMFQSRRHARYDEVIDQLYRSGDLYWCRCTRRDIAAAGGFYPGTCRERGLGPAGCAARLRQHHAVYHFDDALQGRIEVAPALAEEDFIVRRRDGLYAYNLAVVVDDLDSGVTEVVRGADLLEPTVRQIALYQRLGAPVPGWVHLPLAVQPDGSKLSKQNHARALPGEVQAPLLAALAFLGHPVPAELHQASPQALLAWAISAWQLARVPHRVSQPSPVAG